MTRKDKILHCINKNDPGLEIGPSHSPIAPKKEGWNVEVIDHAPREQLVEKYRIHDVNVENIEEVDFVWKGQSFKELTGKEKYYKWIIASHVIEHVPDIIRFFNDCAEIMSDDGVLSLAIPDHRYCFDCFRPISSISKVINAYLSHNLTPTIGDLIENYLYIVKRDGNIAWEECTELREQYEFIYNQNEVMGYFHKLLDNQEYEDCHTWCFTLDSFRLLINDLNMLGLISLHITASFPTEGCEFIVALSKNRDNPVINRMELLQGMQLQILQPQDLQPSENQNNDKNVRQKFFDLFRKADTNES